MFSRENLCNIWQLLSVQKQLWDMKKYCGLSRSGIVQPTHTHFKLCFGWVLLRDRLPNRTLRSSSGRKPVETMSQYKDIGLDSTDLTSLLHILLTTLLMNEESYYANLIKENKLPQHITKIDPLSKVNAYSNARGRNTAICQLYHCDMRII